MDRRDDTRPDFDQTRSVSRRLKLIFEPGSKAVSTLEEAQRLCEIGSAALDDLYCKNVMRAIGACAEYCYWAEVDEPSLRPLIQSLLVAFDTRLDELEYAGDHAGLDTGWYLERRRAQRRNYLLRPAVAPLRRTDSNSSHG